MSDEQKTESFLCNLFNRLFHHKHQETVRETIEDLIEEASCNGEEQFSKHEQLLLNNILSVNDKKCAEVMIPRADIIAFQQDGTIGELAELMVNKGHSRIPIYGESLDDIIGITHVIDLAKCLLKGNPDTKVSTIINNNVKFVSPSMHALELLREMQKQKVHLAMVIDEYGGVDGLITIEDLLEEIVGDIEDEYDIEEEPFISIQPGGAIIADANAELDDIKEASGLDLLEELENAQKSSDSEDNNDELYAYSLGGFVFKLVERIPSRGEIIEGPANIKFQILDVDPRRIKKILIIRPETTNIADNEDKKQ